MAKFLFEKELPEGMKSEFVKASKLDKSLPPRDSWPRSIASSSVLNLTLRIYWFINYNL